MGKNTKPMLTVLVEEDRLKQLRAYALDREVSMGWVVNQLLERLLKGDVDVMTDTPSIAKNRESIESSYTGLSRENIEKIIETSTAQTRESIEKYARGYIELSLDKSLDKTSIDTNDIQKMVNESIEVALEPITVSVTEAEDYTKSQIEKVREDLMSVKKLSAIA